MSSSYSGLGIQLPERKGSRWSHKGLQTPLQSWKGSLEHSVFFFLLNLEVISAFQALSPGRETPPKTPYSGTCTLMCAAVYSEWRVSPRRAKGQSTNQVSMPVGHAPSKSPPFPFIPASEAALPGWGNWTMFPTVHMPTLLPICHLHHPGSRL